ncbi:ABC transporter G family member 3 isoform X2 [Phalaenopsis equestris]|uniref:ABC transporter G family member 3 isoform X2 n=1 Tax=Phalaenopsis equestris TaxID=78828 RepID=UPI0009E19571|nr:ABC transporter G family member 3 isoform X2 [Phalaenopsis equestris]
MEEIPSYSDNYRSSSSSASSPINKGPSGAFFYLRKPGALRKPISFEDSPEWDDVEIDPHIEGEDSIHVATTTASPSLSKVNSGSFPSPSAPSSSVVERRVAGASIVWKDLCVTIKEKRKYSDKVIKSSNGYALPGTLTVIMGPARSGKSTLLRAIAGKLRVPARLYGEVFVNGVKSPMPYGSYLPGSSSHRKALVEDAISAMSLGDYADKLIGGQFFMKRLPHGERRRVSIARELVTRPYALFIDEPLHHLDSVSALLLMVTLKKLASTGCTLIFTMYHSSTEVFGLFDRICLLSNGNTLFFGETLACLQHFSNAGFPCPIMQSPSDHFLRAINTEFDRIIAMCKNFQDDNGDFSSVNMDTAVAIRTLEATYKSSADSAAVESMILRLTEKEGHRLKSKGRPRDVMRITVLTWRTLLTMSRERKYFWIRLLLYILLALSIGTVFSNIGHSLSSVMVRVSAIFVFVSSILLLSIAGLPAHIKEIKIFMHEEANQHSGAMVFLLGHFLASIPFIFLISVSSTLVFYFISGLRNEFNLLVYFVLNIFMCLLANEGLVMVGAYIWFEVFSCFLAFVFLHILMMLVAGYFRIRNDLPEPIWKYPLSYVAFLTYSVQGLLENEFIGTSFAVGEVRAISGLQAVGGSYQISASRNAKWKNLLVLFVMAIGYRILMFLLLRFRIRAIIFNRTSNFWVMIFSKYAR